MKTVLYFYDNSFAKVRRRLAEIRFPRVAPPLSHAPRYFASLLPLVIISCLFRFLFRTHLG